MELIELTELFKKYDIVCEDESVLEGIQTLIDEGQSSPCDLAFELLCELPDSPRLEYYMGNKYATVETIGSIYAENIVELVRLSHGRITVSDLQVTQSPTEEEIRHLEPDPNIDLDIDLIHYMDIEITLSFKHNGKAYTWIFNDDSRDIFIKAFTLWAYDALDGDYLFLDYDMPFAYLIPKGLIGELEGMGLETHIHMWDSLWTKLVRATSLALANRFANEVKGG